MSTSPHPRRRRASLAFALATGAALSLPGTAAHATPPGPGVSGRVLWQRTVGDTDYILREITLPAGQSTGWHYHRGTLYGTVKTGTLSHYDASCAHDGEYRTGAHIVEPPGPGNVHIGRNLGTTDTVLVVLYVNPKGSALSEDAPNPGCDFE